MGAPDWPQTGLPLPRWQESRNTLPDSACLWAGDSKQAVPLCPHRSGEGGEERRGISSQAVLLAPGLENGSQLVLQTGRDAATRDHPPLT